MGSPIGYYADDQKKNRQETQQTYNYKPDYGTVLTPEAIRVELYAEPMSRDTNSIRITMESGEMPTGSGVGLYHATVSKGRPARDYTPRVIPYHAEASVPLEANFILWHE